jgi:DNA-binding transcriptional MerR regulator
VKEGLQTGEMIKKVFPTFSELFQLAKKGFSIEEQQKFMAAWEELVSAKERIHELENEVKDLEEKLKIKSRIDYIAPAYWLKKEDTQENPPPLDGPFCQQCFDAHGLLIRLQDVDQMYLCMNCKNRFWKKRPDGSQSTIRGTGERKGWLNY